MPTTLELRGTIDDCGSIVVLRRLAPSGYTAALERLAKPAEKKAPSSGPAFAKGTLGWLAARYLEL